MASNLSGKIYTDHPLMDEIVYNCKIILNGIVVKNDELANRSEEEFSMDEVEGFMMINNGTVSFKSFPFTLEIFLAYGYSYQQANSYIIDRNNIPEQDRDDLLEFSIKYFIDHYEEKNNYYRMLIGLPPYGTDEYNIYLDESYLPITYKKEVDFSKPIHEFDNKLIAILKNNGTIDELIKTHKGSNYSYLRFLGESKIDLYTARKAKKYDILYLPNVENLVTSRFREIYNLNRDVYLKRTYSQAYAYGSEYYEQIMIFMIIAQTMNDMIVDVPEWYIRRDIFDIRSVQYFLDSFGVPYYKEIPLKYQIRIVKNLNKLIKYKSSNKNFEDIMEIFSVNNISIYKYYLFKKRKLNKGGIHYNHGTKEEDNYELEFVQAKINESYDDYIKDQIYRTSYDDITYQDPYWDGEDEHSYIKNQHLMRDFTIEGTKYMSIEYKISMSNYLFQMEYFWGLLTDSDIDTNDIKIFVPSLDSESSFRVSDLYLYLLLLTLGYDNVNTKIIRPEDVIKTVDGEEKPEFEPYDEFDGGYYFTKEDKYDSVYSTNASVDSRTFLSADGGNVYYSEFRSIEDYYDWMKDKLPEMFISKNNKVYGFNRKVNLDALEEIIQRRHSTFQFDNGYKGLEDFKVDNYIIPTKISSIDELMNIYLNNKKCYDDLKNIIVESVDNRDKMKTARFIFDELFTKEFDYDAYKISNSDSKATYLEEILEDRDYILYNNYLKIMSENNIESRKDNIRNIMNDVVDTLEYYISGEGLQYIYAFSTTCSFTSIVQYLHLMITFFKSYKVYFLDPYITYVLDDKLENMATGHDTIANKQINYLKNDKLFGRDNISINVIFNLEDRYNSNIKEVLDIYSHFEPDPNDDYDYNGMYPDSETVYPTYKDGNGGVADESMNIPYIMINGGNPSEGRIDLWDLNGAGPLEMNDYLDVDGGYYYDFEGNRKDYYGTAFSYIIDGGSPGTKEFLSRSVHTRIVDNQISSDIRISNRTGNIIEQNEDGIFIKENWIDWKEFNELKEDEIKSLQLFDNSYNNMKEITNILLHPEKIDDTIKEGINRTLNSMTTFMTNMKDDKFENSLKEYIDKKNSDLYEEYSLFSPFIWDNF